jgi:hypothetical protein
MEAVGTALLPRYQELSQAAKSARRGAERLAGAMQNITVRLGVLGAQLDKAAKLPPGPVRSVQLGASLSTWDDFVAYLRRELPLDEHALHCTAPGVAGQIPAADGWDLTPAQAFDALNAYAAALERAAVRVQAQNFPSLGAASCDGDGHSWTTQEDQQNVLRALSTFEHENSRLCSATYPVFQLKSEVEWVGRRHELDLGYAVGFLLAHGLRGNTELASQLFQAIGQLRRVWTTYGRMLDGPSMMTPESVKSDWNDHIARVKAELSSGGRCTLEAADANAKALSAQMDKVAMALKDSLHDLSLSAIAAHAGTAQLATNLDLLQPRIVHGQEGLARAARLPPGPARNAAIDAINFYDWFPGVRESVVRETALHCTPAGIVGLIPTEDGWDRSDRPTEAATPR